MSRIPSLPLALLLIGLSAAPASAEVQTLLDNDSNGFVPGPATTDRNYTQGLRLNYFGAPNGLPARVRALADRLPGFHVAGEERQFGISIGQEIYTPDAISRPKAIPDDRPYAGWAFAAGLLTARGERVTRSLEVQLGAIGDDSQAAVVQRWWHRELGIRAPQGWPNQLRDEPGLVVSYQERHRPWGRRDIVDFVPHAGVTLGNVHTEANAGGTLRVGLPLPDDFGPWRAAPAPARERFALSLFARAEGRAVARNIFLDGNTFTSSLRVHRVPWVGEAQLGAAARWHGAGLRYTFTYTTREFRERPLAQEYGSFTLSF